MLSGSDTFYVYVALKKCAGLLVSKPDSALIYWQNPPPVITVPHGKMVSVEPTTVSMHS